MKKYIYITLVVFLVGCFLPDEVLPSLPSHEVTVELNLKENNTVYLNLENSKNPDSISNEWHLKFQNAADGWSIYLNTLESVAIYNTKETDFTKVDYSYFDLDLPWQVDVPTPSGLYPALGAWGDFQYANPKSFKNVYLVSWNDGQINYISKLQILDASKDAYHIRFGPLGEENSQSVWIQKDAAYTHGYFSFQTGLQLNSIEPKIANWDMCFTYLSDSLVAHTATPATTTINPYFGLYPGVVVNYQKSKIHLDTSANFENIDYFYAKELKYTGVDQLYNVFYAQKLVYKGVDDLFNAFYSWDGPSQQLILNERLTVVVQQGEKYFALRPKKVETNSLQAFKLTLEVKQL